MYLINLYEYVLPLIKVFNQVSSGNPTQKFDKHSNLKKKFTIFKPSDLECLLPAEYSQISSCGSPSSKSEVGQNINLY